MAEGGKVDIFARNHLYRENYDNIFRKDVEEQLEESKKLREKIADKRNIAMDPTAEELEELFGDE